LEHLKGASRVREKAKHKGNEPYVPQFTKVASRKTLTTTEIAAILEDVCDPK
jgi:hypothetical protein